MITRNNTFSVSMFIRNLTEKEQRLIDPPKQLLVQCHDTLGNSGW